MKELKLAMTNQITVGDRWAYRVHWYEDLVEVEVKAVNTTKPARVQVRFVDKESAGAEWIPVARLKVPWSQSGAFAQAERQMRQLNSMPDEVEWDAASTAVSLLFQGAAGIGMEKENRGTILIVDPTRVDESIGGGLGELLKDAESVAVPNGIYYGWPIAVSIARRACARFPQRVLTHVKEEESDPRWAHIREKHIQPYLDLLTEWCAYAPPARSDWLTDSLEVARFKEFFENSLALLADAGEQHASREMFRIAYPGKSDGDWRGLIARDADRRDEWRAGLQ